MEAGFDAAVRVVEKRGKHAAPEQDDGGQPVFGMPGRRFVPGQGVR
jgi:hypothetical protein